MPGFAANRALRGGGDAPAALRAEGISQARDGTARLRMRGVTLHDATAAEIAAQAARETRSSARMSGVPLKVIKDWKEGMTQEERERVIGEQKLTEEQVATLDATAHARALAEAAGDRTLTLEEEVVEINRQIEKLGEADEEEAIQMLNAELQAEEEAKRTEEAKKREAAKAKEETPKEGDGLPRAAEEKPDAGGEAAGRELEALRVRAAELDDRLRRKGLRKAERNKIAEELAGVQARMQELSGGDLVLFSRGEAAAGRPALSPTKAALRDRLLLKIARTAGIHVIREGSEAIAASAARAQGEARYKKENDRFNAELEAFEKRASNNVIHLGVPGEILRACGLNDTEMFIRPKVLRSHMNTHGINIADVRNLPGALNNPLMVYEWGTKARSLIVITDLTLKDGRKITAAVKLERNGKAAEVNELASVHGKDAARFIRDMENAKSGGLEKALRYVSDKEKALAWLGNVPPRGTTEAPQGLHLQKIIEDFENPSIKNIRFKREAFSATAEERAGIEREAKAKGTWLKAPNGNPSELTPEQWVTVRTRAFKEWFGDWEKAARIEKLRQASSVELKGYSGQYELTRDSARKWIKSNLEGKSYVIADTGETVRIGKAGRNKVTSHGYGNEAHMKSIADIPAMLENATFITEELAEKKDSKYPSYRYYVVGANIGETDYTVKIALGVAYDGTLYYDHSLTQIEKGALINLALAEQRRTQDFENALTGIKDNKLLSVLQVNSSKIVDENGEPLVVYHGTDADFTVFDRAKTRATMDIQGNFFSPWEDDARGYGSNVRRFFLNLRNPADENTGYHSLHEFEGQNGAGVKARERLVALGYDGVNNGGEEFIAFSPEQIKSATENVGTFDAGDPDIRYSLGAAEQAAWHGVLDAYEAGRLPARGMVTVLPRTPAVLQRCGAANLPIKISKGVLDKVTKEKHGVPVRELRGLLTNLDNPIAVFRSRTQADSLVVLTELRDEANGNNAVVAVRLDAKSDSEHEINAVASIYGKNPYSVDGMLRDGLALYVHTQKIRAYLRSSRLQLPAETSRRGSSSLLTQDDFTQDELGVVKVNNKKPLDGRGEVYGAYDPRTREVFVAENARVDTLLHELGWHAAYDWARTHEPKLYAQMRSYAQSAPEEVRAAVREVYAGFSEEAMLDEIGAAAFSEEFTGLVEERLAEIKDGRRRGIVKRWWAGFKKLAVRLWRALTGRSVPLQKIPAAAGFACGCPQASCRLRERPRFLPHISGAPIAPRSDEARKVS